MTVLGIYGSPRQGGNSDQLLDQALEGARSAGATIEKVYARDLKMSGCLECGGCTPTGVCVVQDEMARVYPLLEEARVTILSSPIFFYGVTAQLKALVDRVQAMWSKRLLEKKTPEERKRYDHGKGYLIAVGATKGKTLFDGSQMMAKYFFDALDMTYEGGLFYKGIEYKGNIKDNPEALREAYDLGVKAVQGEPGL